MATLASTDITVTISRARINRGSPGGQRVNVAKLVFGDGSLTYPASGLTVPSYTSFGLVRELEYLNIIDQSATGLQWKYDYVNKKLRCVSTATELTTGATVPAQTLYVEAKGW